MDTQPTQHNIDFPRTDPALDALLDEAVSVGTPAPDPQLAERIYQHTLPMLTRRPVLARIGPTLLRVAAAVAIVAGGVLAMSVLSRQEEPVVVEVDTQDATGDLVERLGPEIKAIASAVEPGNTRIDEQLDVLALRVDLASAEGAWGAAGQSTSDLIDQAVVRFEMDQLSDDSSLYFADEQTLF